MGFCALKVALPRINTSALSTPGSPPAYWFAIKPGKRPAKALFRLAVGLWAKSFVVIVATAPVIVSLRCLM